MGAFVDWIDGCRRPHGIGASRAGTAPASSPCDQPNMALGNGIGEGEPALFVHQQQSLGGIGGDGVGQIELVLKQLLGPLQLGVVANDLG